MNAIETEIRKLIGSATVVNDGGYARGWDNAVDAVLAVLEKNQHLILDEADEAKMMFEKDEQISLDDRNPRKTEYAVEVYGASGAFDRQLDVFNSFEEAEKFKNDCDEPLADGEYIGVLAIHYDEHGDENTVERL